MNRKEVKTLQEYNDILKNIKILMIKKDIKQKDIADGLGIPHNTFSNMMTGTTQIKTRHIPVIAKVLGVTPNDIFGWEDEK